MNLSDCGSGIYGASVKGEIVPCCGAHEGIGLLFFFHRNPSVVKGDYSKNSHVVFCQNKNKSILFNPLCFLDIVGLIVFMFMSEALLASKFINDSISNRLTVFVLCFERAA